MSTQISQEAFEYLNKIRKNPTLAITKLQQHLSYFKGNLLCIPGEINLRTNEGTAVYHECIAFLQKQKPLPELTYNKELELACNDHVNDTGPKGVTGHVGTDGSSLEDRIERYAEWMGSIGENISFGQKTGEDVDDGVSSRGHRKNCFGPNFLLVGIADGKHKQYKQMCVMDFAGEITPKGAKGVKGHQVKANPIKQQQQNVKLQNNFQDEEDDFQKQFDQMKLQQQGQLQQQQSHQQRQQGHPQPKGKGDMPAGCVSMSTNTSVSVVNGKKHTKVTKKYTMADGSTKTEIEETISG